jgi:hypothetical protein
LTQGIDTTSLREKQIKRKASVKAKVVGVGNPVHLWMRVNRKGGFQGFFENMKEPPIPTGE